LLYSDSPKKEGQGSDDDDLHPHACLVLCRVLHHLCLVFSKHACQDSCSFTPGRARVIISSCVYWWMKNNSQGWREHAPAKIGFLNLQHRKFVFEKNIGMKSLRSKKRNQNAR
jgi:hypothetical protein